jgi:hypothetical protein
LCPTPVAETEFAGDSVFGYTHSYLPDDGEEKTQGRIVAGDVDASCWPTCAVSVEIDVDRIIPAPPVRFGDSRRGVMKSEV